MEEHLRAGIAIYDAGQYHAAHDAWERRWLTLERGTDDERLLHGLIQFTAAVHHATRRNWQGATGLAASGREYLEAVPPNYREVNVDDARTYLARLGDDPSVIERAPPWPLTYEGRRIEYEDLEGEALTLAAVALAEAENYDEELFERAGAFDESRIETLLRDFLREDEHRGIIARRLGEHVGRLEAQRSDVEDLF